MGAVLEFAAQLETEICFRCSMQFAVPSDFKRRRLEDKAAFYCPAGHSQYCLGETEAQKLRRQLEQKERELQTRQVWLESARKERDHHESRARALKGVITKAKNRVGHGVCPCCTRQFQNLRRHMTSKHPDYAKSEAEK